MNWNDLFLYCDGNLFYKFSNNKRKTGDKAGTNTPLGYLVLKHKGNTYGIHRIIWEMHNTKIPHGFVIDHINHDRKDNRIENLRLVDRTNNARNTNLYKNNTSGVVGVNWHKESFRWCAYIKVNKLLYLGSYVNKEDAIKARKEAEIKYGFHLNHGMQLGD